MPAPSVTTIAFSSMELLQPSSVAVSPHLDLTATPNIDSALPLLRSSKSYVGADSAGRNQDSSPVTDAVSSNAPLSGDIQGRCASSLVIMPSQTIPPVEISGFVSVAVNNLRSLESSSDTSATISSHHFSSLVDSSRRNPLPTVLSTADTSFVPGLMSASIVGQSNIQSLQSSTDNSFAVQSTYTGPHSSMGK